LNALWQLLKAEKKEEFLGTISEQLSYMRRIVDLAAALPLPAVSCMELLLTEAVRLFSLDAAEYQAKLRLLRPSAGMSGSEWLDQILRLFEQLFDQRKRMKQTRSSKLIEQVERYIEEHFQENVSLSQIAEAFHYHPSYLSRLYKEQTGNAIMDQVNALKIRHAKTLLSDSTEKITSIARQCGFQSTKYFNQVFKKHVGMSPAAYREESGGEG